MGVVYKNKYNVLHLFHIYIYIYIYIYICFSFGLHWWLSHKESLCNAGDLGDMCLFLGLEDPLEEMATYSRILAWKIPWTEEPGVLQSKGCKVLDTTELLSTHMCAHTHKHT